MVNIVGLVVVNKIHLRLLETTVDDVFVVVDDVFVVVDDAVTNVVVVVLLVVDNHIAFTFGAHSFSCQTQVQLRLRLRCG